MASKRFESERVALEYETFGKASDPCILLIMGFSTQMIVWPEWFCEALAEAGHFVVRFDNRDVGLSRKFDHLGKPDIRKLLAKRMLGLKVSAPYSLEEMARDSIELLDHLEVETAHVVGMSMGGMIAQLLALDYVDRVQSVTIWASSPGRKIDLLLDPRVALSMLRPVSRDPETRIREAVEFWQVIGSPGFPSSDKHYADKTRRAIERSDYIDGNARQFAAIIAAPSRIEWLKQLRVPALVIHGDADKLVPLRGGRAMAAAIPDAELMFIAGYGHDLPDSLLPRIKDAIVSHVERAERA